MGQRLPGWRMQSAPRSIPETGHQNPLIGWSEFGAMVRLKALENGIVL